MNHAMAGAFALAVPVFFVLYGFVAFIIISVRGRRADKDARESTPKQPQRPLPKKLRDRKKHRTR
jgi:hypothetical protein